ncbi:MAG TPA: ACP S-malonyltransferase [bacterium]|nr:ACP S-malonyltransferase [bacterium]
MRLAAVFPGQGTQYVGMGRELAERCAPARAVFERAGAALGFDVLALCAEGPEEALRETANTQPAILVTSLACLAAVPFQPDCAAGLSLGEYTALVCAGALEMEDAVRLVRLRGTYMQEACAGRDTMMAAVMGLTPDQARGACTPHARLGVVEPSNFNSPGQVVIGGDAVAVRAALETAKALGARRAMPLAVSAPFHTSLMRPAADRLAAALERTPIRPARIPVFANVSAGPVRTADEIRRALLAQMASPVLWEQSVRAMHAAGVRGFVEFGPGTTLGGMIRRTVEAEAWHVEDLASRETTVAALAHATGSLAHPKNSVE